MTKRRILNLIWVSAGVLYVDLGFAFANAGYLVPLVPFIEAVGLISAGGLALGLVLLFAVKPKDGA